MPHRYLWRRLKNFFIYRVLHVDDTPHRIALGVAVGMWVAWTPTIPFQMVLTFLLAWVLGANKVVGLPFVWFSNPLTIVPIYGPNYVVGCWLLGSEFQGFKQIIQAADLRGNFVEVAQRWWHAIQSVAWELSVGSVLVASVIGTATYFTILHAVIAYRNYRHRRELQHVAEEALAGPADHACDDLAGGHGHHHADSNRHPAPRRSEQDTVGDVH
jgi:hypothetical protein